MRLPLLLLPLSLVAQQAGFQSEYLKEFEQASWQVVTLAEAMPAEKFAWRPAAGVRSVSEVYMHIATGNFLILSQAGVKPPADLYPQPPADGAAFFKRDLEIEKTVTDKQQVILWLKRSFEAVKQSFPKAELDRRLKFFNRDTTVRALYLRILVHLNEHMGQSVAYARMNGVAPPWSK